MSTDSKSPVDLLSQLNALEDQPSELSSPEASHGVDSSSTETPAQDNLSGDVAALESNTDTVPDSSGDTPPQDGSTDLLSQLEQLEGGGAKAGMGSDANLLTDLDDDDFDSDKLDAQTTANLNAGSSPAAPARKSVFGQAVAALRERHFKKPVIHVLVHSGQNLPDVLLVGTQDPFVRITVLPTGQVKSIMVYTQKYTCT